MKAMNRSAIEKEILRFCGGIYVYLREVSEQFILLLRRGRMSGLGDDLGSDSGWKSMQSATLGKAEFTAITFRIPRNIVVMRTRVC